MHAPAHSSADMPLAALRFSCTRAHPAMVPVCGVFSNPKRKPLGHGVTVAVVAVVVEVAIVVVVAVVVVVVVVVEQRSAFLV